MCKKKKKKDISASSPISALHCAPKKKISTRAVNGIIMVLHNTDQYQGCTLRKFLGSPLGSQPCQLGCPALKVGRPAPPPPPPPQKKEKKKRIFFGSSRREVFRNESISQFIFFKTHVVITLQATNKCLLLFTFPFQRTHKFC